MHFFAGHPQALTEKNWIKLPVNPAKKNLR